MHVGPADLERSMSAAEMAQEGAAAAEGTPPPVTPSPASDKSPRTPTPSPSDGPDAVVALGLSYPTHLVGALSTVKRRGAEAQTECGELARAMKDLAAVEKTYAQGLAAIAGRLEAALQTDGEERADPPTREALARVASNLRGSSEQHGDLAAHVAMDVARPLAAARGEAAATAAECVKRGVSTQRAVRGADDRYRRALAAYRHKLTDAAAKADAAVEAGVPPAAVDAEVAAAAARAAAAGAPEDDDAARAPPDEPASPDESSAAGILASAPSETEKKHALRWTSRLTSTLSGRASALGSSASAAMGFASPLRPKEPSPKQAHQNKKLEQWLLPTEAERRAALAGLAAQAARDAAAARADADDKWAELRNESRACALEAQRVLAEYQCAEELVVDEIRDSLRKLCVFESSALSNRKYDLQALTKVLDDVLPATQLKAFVLATAPGDAGDGAPVVVHAATLFAHERASLSTAMADASTTEFKSALFSKAGYGAPADVGAGDALPSPAAVAADPERAEGAADDDVRRVPLPVAPPAVGAAALGDLDLVRADACFALLEEAQRRADADDKARTPEPEPFRMPPRVPTSPAHLDAARAPTTPGGGLAPDDLHVDDDADESDDDDPGSPRGSEDHGRDACGVGDEVAEAEATAGEAEEAGSGADGVDGGGGGADDDAADAADAADPPDAADAADPPDDAADPPDDAADTDA